MTTKSSEFSGPRGVVHNDAKTGPKGEPMTPIPSASLVILCPLGAGNRQEYATLMVQRSAQGSSFRSAMVFPGGLLDQADEYAVKRSSKKYDDLQEYGVSLQLCALRETFEESGVLLVPSFDKPQCSRAVGPNEIGMSGEEWMSMRKQVHDDARAFPPFLSQVVSKIRSTSDNDFSVQHVAPLLHFSNWITPRALVRPAKRFDTHFFVTILDQGDVLGPLTSAIKEERPKAELSKNVRDVSNISADGKEVSHLCLATPQELTHLALQDAIILFPPQYYILVDIAISLADESFAPSKLTPLLFGDKVQNKSENSNSQRPCTPFITPVEPQGLPAAGGMVSRNLNEGQDDDSIFLLPLVLPGDVLRPLDGQMQADHTIALNRVYVSPRAKGEGGGLAVHGVHRRNIVGLQDFKHGTCPPELEVLATDDREDQTKAKL